MATHVQFYHHVWILILMLITFSKHVSLACPSGMIEVNPTLCIIKLNATRSLCEAGYQCAEYGRSTGRLVFLIGRNFHKAGHAINTPYFYVWTSYTLFLHSAIRTKFGWHDGDPRDPLFEITREDQLPWKAGQPQGSGAASVVELPANVFHDATNSPVIPFDTVCELITETKGLPKITEYRFNYPRVPPNEMFSRSSEFDGCVVASSKSTLLSCTFKCSQRFDCRSVYFNENENLCLLVLYFDARIPRSFANITGSWLRYAKA